MKWDIDKALTALEDCTFAGTSISRVDIMGADLIKEKLGSVTDAERAKEGILVWCIALGKIPERKHFVYGRTIRTAYLRARREIKGMSPEELKFFGLRAPKKPGSKARTGPYSR